MATLSFDIPNEPILAGLKKVRGFDAAAVNPGAHTGVQLSTDDLGVHVTLNFQLTSEEWAEVVGPAPTI